MKFISFLYRPNIFKDDTEEVLLNAENFSHIVTASGRVNVVTKSNEMFEIVCIDEAGEEFLPDFLDVANVLIAKEDYSVISLIHIKSIK